MTRLSAYKMPGNLQKHLELRSEFNEVAGHKVNAQASVYSQGSAATPLPRAIPRLARRWFLNLGGKSGRKKSFAGLGLGKPGQLLPRCAGPCHLRMEGRASLKEAAKGKTKESGDGPAPGDGGCPARPWRKRPLPHPPGPPRSPSHSRRLPRSPGQLLKEQHGTNPATGRDLRVICARQGASLPPRLNDGTALPLVSGAPASQVLRLRSRAGGCTSSVHTAGGCPAPRRSSCCHRH